MALRSNVCAIRSRSNNRVGVSSELDAGHGGGSPLAWTLCIVGPANPAGRGENNEFARAERLNNTTTTESNTPETRRRPPRIKDGHSRGSRSRLALLARVFGWLDGTAFACVVSHWSPVCAQRCRRRAVPVSGEGNTVSGGSGGGGHVDLHSNPQVPSPVDPRACWTNVRKKKPEAMPVCRLFHARV